jgi:hypothetical protein
MPGLVLGLGISIFTLFVFGLLASALGNSRRLLGAACAIACIVLVLILIPLAYSRYFRSLEVGNLEGIVRFWATTLGANWEVVLATLICNLHWLKSIFVSEGIKGLFAEFGSYPVKIMAIVFISIGLTLVGLNVCFITFVVTGHEFSRDFLINIADKAAVFSVSLFFFSPWSRWLVPNFNRSRCVKTRWKRTDS